MASPPDGALLRSKTPSVAHRQVTTSLMLYYRLNLALVHC